MKSRRRVTIMDWLFRRMTSDLTSPRDRDSDLDITVTPAPHAPTEPNKTLSERAARPLAELTERFTYHAPTPPQITKYNSLRTRAKEFAFLIDELCPDSDERDHALHYLDAVVMNANAAIARHS